MKSIRLILHGKSSDEPELRDAVAELRNHGHDVSVRVTWEAGDAARFAREAVADDISVIVAGGGDGSLNEVVNGVMHGDTADRGNVAVAVLPMGSANDFAASCGIPEDPMLALRLAAEGSAAPIDVGKANDRFFINVASGGFGAQVTATTPDELKRALGGVAYALMGFATVILGHETRRVRIQSSEFACEDTLVMMAIGNGRQSGGGFAITPKALLDDGLLDATFVREFPTVEAAAVAREISEPDSEENRFVFALRSSGLTVESAEDEIEFFNLDGEPSPPFHSIRFEVRPRALKFVLPPAASHLLSAP